MYSEGGTPATWRLDRIADVSVIDRPALVLAEFSLPAFVDRSFVALRDEVEDVRLQKSAPQPKRPWAGASIPRAVTPQADGGVLVEFQVAAYCSSWPGTCSPGATRSRSWPRPACAVMAGQLDLAARALRGGPA